ncbi:3'-5' exonuclease [Herbiconiux sp. KACC 21604]|uniref:3'-5' exonuclease n=1 Tax=unclassified Herbiconiux TaxID=2618217 RepID=UPI001492EBEB|nr:3'-5' exonuclease [Herbiconiux sp. SALV-R1]QJU54278.1 3'-5' exonuclease [Herbiconiux sp. SALV-R1]WPO85346.1 3'-5' exonuclease [Herbiconiux sp. KACC 21604]
MTGPGFATIDFETTGLQPGRHRAVEVAVVHSDADGTVTGRWDTLIDPGDGLGPGPTRIHRITAAQLRGAPRFADIARGLMGLLAGRVMVAHNASFDRRFLLAELAAAGYRSWAPAATLCTLQLSRQFLPHGPRSLAACCAAFAIELKGAHRASVDALATAQLLGAYLDHSPARDGWNELLARAAAQPVPGGGAETGQWVPRERAGGGVFAAPALPSFGFALG